MKPWQELDSVSVSASGARLCLLRRGDEYSIRIDRYELMNSRLHASEDALAQLCCAKIAHRPYPRLLVGGLGMGFTVAAAIRHLPPSCQLVVAELVPAVVNWNRGLLADLAGRPTEDPRVTVRELDVARVLKAEQQAFDAIILDVDNGPEGMTRPSNDWLYSRAGLAAAWGALRPAGVLAVWSAAPSPAFRRRLQEGAFQVDEHRVRSRGPRRGSQHTIWIARRGS